MNAGWSARRSWPARTSPEDLFAVTRLWVAFRGARRRGLADVPSAALGGQACGARRADRRTGPAGDASFGRTSEPGGTITSVSTQGALSSSRLVEMSAELPEVVLKEGLNWTSITFKGRGFAWVNHPENRAMIKAHHDERDALLATAPEVYEAGWATNSSAWVRVRLELADPEEVFELLEEAWRMTATKRAIKAFDEARER